MGEEHSRKTISPCRGLEETIGSLWGAEDSLLETQSGRQGPARAGSLVVAEQVGVHTPVRRTPPFSLSIFMTNPHDKGFLSHFTDGGN